MLDPACGSGTFLFHAIRLHLAEAEESGTPRELRAQEAARLVAGIDIHPGRGHHRESDVSTRAGTRADGANGNGEDSSLPRRRWKWKCASTLGTRSSRSVCRLPREDRLPR